MEPIFFIGSIYLLISVVAAVIAYHLDVSIALVEICLGIAAAAVADRFFGAGALAGNQPWLQFLASAGAVLLTFLAGAELDPAVMREKVREVSVVGLVGFVAPFGGGTVVARFILGWSVPASFLGGIALSTTSMAVVYAVMLETGLNKTAFGKGILGACFINDLGTVIALGLAFAPFTYRTVVFVGVSAVLVASLPAATRFITRVYGNRTAAVRTKWVMAVLLGLGTLAYWSGSEAVLPAYVVGIVLAEFASAEHLWLRRVRTLTTGFLTPFYFIRAGSFVSVPALIAAPSAFLLPFLAKVLSKIFGLYPVISRFRRQRQERWYYTPLMSTGLTFGTISALYGFTHGIVTQAQYSALVATVIASAVIPTLITGQVFLPRHLLAPSTSARPSLTVPEGSPRTSRRRADRIRLLVLWPGVPGCGTVVGGWPMKLRNRMKLLNRWKSAARRLRLETYTLYYAYRNRGTPWYARAWGALVVAYALSPIDLIPDFIPVLGLLDDLVLIPLGVAIAVRLIPKSIYQESKALAFKRIQEARPNWAMGGIVIAIWVAVAALLTWWILRKVKVI